MLLLLLPPRLPRGTAGVYMTVVPATVRTFTVLLFPPGGLVVSSVAAALSLDSARGSPRSHAARVFARVFGSVLFGSGAEEGRRSGHPPAPMTARLAAL